MSFTPDPSEITAIIPTRGNAPLERTVKHLPYGEIIVWDNSKLHDFGIFARYMAIKGASNEIIFTQDDDVVVTGHETLMESYRPGRITALVPESCGFLDPDLCLLGYGAMFHMSLPWLAFDRYRRRYPFDSDFTHRTCDIFFGMLTPFKRFVGGVEVLPFAQAPGRVSNTGDWSTERGVAKMKARMLQKNVRLNLGCGDHPLEGFVNLDRPTWEWVEGIPYPDASVEAITISHSLMYAPLEIWAPLFADFYRALKKGGVVRITEDATDDSRSERYGGFHDAVTNTTYGMVANHLEGAGFMAGRMEADITLWKDKSLLQDWHGGWPKCFFIEGLKR